jgi:bud site selection protein 31
MPKPPKGFELISAGLDEYDQAMKEALAETTEGKRKSELTHGIAKVNRQRTRFVFEAMKNKQIERRVVDYCVACCFIDGALVKLWSLPGYESACCVACVDGRQSTFGGACVCRVPGPDRVTPLCATRGCARCGCTGCSAAGESGGAAAAKNKE